MSELTKDLSVVAGYIVDLMRTDAVPTIVKDVYYGPQRLISTFPALQVETMPKDRSYAATRQYQIIFNIHLVVMWGKVDQEAQLSRKETDQKAEALEDILTQDRKFGGLLYTSMVTRIDPRITLRNTPKIKASRIQWQGESREVF